MQRYHWRCYFWYSRFSMSGILKNEEKRAAGLVGLRHLIVIGQNSGTEFVLFSLMNVPKS
jgi:hypothetical protein